MSQDRDKDASPVAVVFWATLLLIPAMLFSGFIAALDAMAKEASMYCRIMKNPKAFGKGKLK